MASAGSAWTTLGQEPKAGGYNTLVTPLGTTMLTDPMVYSKPSGMTLGSEGHEDIGSTSGRIQYVCVTLVVRQLLSSAHHIYADVHAHH